MSSYQAIETARSIPGPVKRNQLNQKYGNRRNNVVYRRGLQEEYEISAKSREKELKQNMERVKEIREEKQKILSKRHIRKICNSLQHQLCGTYQNFLSDPLANQTHRASLNDNSAQNSSQGIYSSGIIGPQGETVIQKIGQSLSNQVLDVQRQDSSRGGKGKSGAHSSQARVAATGSRATRMSKDVDANRQPILSDKSYKIDELLNNPMYNDPSSNQIVGLQCRESRLNFNSGPPLLQN